MCGIVGYIGNKPCKDILLKGLKKLEYRGYDSCGIVSVDKEKFDLHKSVSRIDNLVNDTKDIELSNVGIGHTRWATHRNS
ncbi:MAG: hypothetical protein J6C46_05450 [Clostridia bacterium]|nr:hypothetical protein [Clostridia bacterium]